MARFSYLQPSRGTVSRNCFTAMALVGFLILPSACQRNDKIVSVQEPKDPAPLVMDNTDAAPPPSLPGGTYTKPVAWVSRQPRGDPEIIRFDTSDASDTACTVSILRGWDWQSNIVRWEKQVDMNPTAPQQLPSLQHPAKVGGVDATEVQLHGSQQQMIATVVPLPNGNFCVFKIMGPIDEVNAARLDYDAMLNSVHWDEQSAEAETSAPAPSTAPSESSGVPFTWTAPANWKPDIQATEFRTAGWTVGSGAAQAEITISTPFSASTWDLPSSMQMWGQQVGLPESDGAKTGPVSVRIGGQPAMEVDLTGPAAPNQQPRRLIVAFTGNQSLYFFKIQGPADVVAQQKSAFDQFLAGVNFKAVP